LWFEILAEGRRVGVLLAPHSPGDDEMIDPSELDQPFQTLQNAMQPIVDEMFQNGPEEGCRIWEDASHPLHQAIKILMQAQCQLPSTIKTAAAFLEQHRRMEEGLSL